MPDRRRPLPDAIIQIETQHVLSFPQGLPEGSALCTVCGEVMDRETWARTTCEPPEARDA
jgi:hypothetical protein